MIKENGLYFDLLGPTVATSVSSTRLTSCFKYQLGGKLAVRIPTTRGGGWDVGSGAGRGPKGHSRPHVLSPEVEAAPTGRWGRRAIGKKKKKKKKKKQKRKGHLWLEGVSSRFKQTDVNNIYTATNTHTKQTQPHTQRASTLNTPTLSTHPLTQHSSTNTHKHIRTHFHTYPQTDTNKRTHTPRSNGCQDKNNVNDLERGRSILCICEPRWERKRDKWWCAEKVSGVIWQRWTWVCVYSTWIKSHALTLTSVVVTFGWVTLQGMTSGCFSFRYNTSGLIPGGSTNGCWLSETQTLRSGTHTVLIISMSNKCINKDYFYMRLYNCVG